MHYSSYHVYLHLSLYSGSSFVRCPMVHTLTSVGQKGFQYAYNMFPLFRAIVKFRGTNRSFTFTEDLSINRIYTIRYFSEYFTLNYFSL